MSTRRKIASAPKQAAIYAIALNLAICVAASAQPSVGDRGAGLAGPASLAPMQGGSVRALIMGINAYQTPRIAPILQGAVADALDIAAALRDATVTDVKLLLDNAVTRAAVLSELETLERAAKPGDLAIITFAGHGSQEAERVLNSEEDGKDELFVLSGFSDEEAGTQERILDDELFAVFQRLNANGVEVIFLADTCHAGGMTKDASGGRRKHIRGLARVDRPEDAGEGAYYISPEADRLQLANVAPSEFATDALKSLSFLAAVESATVAPEIEIDGVQTLRGAASYAFARALRGEADADGDQDGVTTCGELLRFVRAKVGNLTAQGQKPVLEPRTETALTAPLFKLKRQTVLEMATSAVTLSITGASDAEIASIRTSAPNFQLVSSATQRADIKWNAQSRELRDWSGRVIATQFLSSQLPRAAERVRSIRILETMALKNPLGVTLDPARKSYRHQEIFDLRINGVDGAYVILVNIAGDGKVQFLYPPANADPLSLARQASFKLQSLPPFGADVMIAATLRNRNPALENELRLLNDEPKPLLAMAILQKVVESGGKIGFVSYVTTP